MVNDGYGRAEVQVEAEAERQWQIVAFCCQYCAYSAADLAGQLRMQYPPAVKIVHLPCSGKVDQLLALHALEAGADGVMVIGCLPGDCHFLRGNLNAARRMDGLRQRLAEIGLEPERARMFNLSAAMAPAFVAATEEMLAQITALGPSPLRQPPAASANGREEDARLPLRPGKLDKEEGDDHRRA